MRPVLSAALVCAGLVAATPGFGETCALLPEMPARSGGAAPDPLHTAIKGMGPPHVGSHGQVMFGAGPHYLSHLPVFMDAPDQHPHNFQVILEVAIENAQDLATFNSAQATATDVMTALPVAFDQGRLVAGYPGLAPLSRLPGTAVFDGHFEQGGTAISRSTNLAITRVVHFHEFRHDLPRSDQMTYLVFGGADGVFAAHILSGPPDFDHLLRLELSGPLPAGLADGVYLQMEARANTVEDRLRAGQVLTCSDGTMITAGADIYCEAGEFDALVTAQFNRPRRCM